MENEFETVASQIFHMKSGMVVFISTVYPLLGIR